MKSFLNHFSLLLVFLLPLQTQLILAEYSLYHNANTGPTAGLFIIEILTLLLASLVCFHYRHHLLQITKYLSQQIHLLVASSLLLFATIITLLLNPHLLSLVHLIHLLSACALILIILLQPHLKHKFILAFASGLIPSVILGIYQVIFGHSPASTYLGLAERSASNLGDSIYIIQDQRILRAYGFFSHPNIFAGYLTTALILLNTFTSKLNKKIIPALNVILIIGLILTFSKSAIIALFLTTIIYYSSTQKITSNKSILISTSILAILALRLLINQIELMSFQDRVNQWLDYFPLLTNNFINFLFGFGPGQYIFNWLDYNPNLDWWLYQPIHNVPVLILAEIGVIGFLLLFFILYKIFRTIPNQPHNLHILLISIPLIIISLFDHYLWSYWSGLVLFAFILASILTHARLTTQ